MWAITLSLCLFVLTLWVTWRKKQLNTFKLLNIPGPEPGFFFGNLWDIVQKGQQNCFKEWLEQYGRVFGYYFGLTPVLVIEDPEMLRIILVKEFEKFRYRPKLFEVGSSSSDYNKYNLLSAQGKKWKQLRTIISPNFTALKLKMMNPIMNEAADELLEAVDKESARNKYFDINELYQNFTMDVTVRTSLGIHSQAQKNKSDPFLKLVRIIMSIELGYFSLVTYSFPEIMPLFSALRRAILIFRNEGKHPRGELQERTRLVIKARRNNPSDQPKDLLQLLMDAKANSENVKGRHLTIGEDDDELVDGTIKENSSGIVQKLSDEEVVQNAVLFVIAGYETTGTSLAFATHLLAYHQDIQDSIREEIKSILPEGEHITYETIQKLHCLNGVLNESLRLLPPISNGIVRLGCNDLIVKGIHIPKNLQIQVPVYNLHRDQTYWKEPEKFDPYRWTREEKAKRHPMAFQAFGAGPRNCIGLRFAQMEGKLALAKLLNKYKILPVPGTKMDDLKISHTVITSRLKDGVFVAVKKFE